MRVLTRHPSFFWVLGFVVFYCLFILSATAAQVAKATSPGVNSDGSRDVITLHSEQGPICPPDAKRAVYFVGKSKETIEGCYVVRGPMVFLGFMDGDSGQLSVDTFTWEGAAPQSAPSPNQGVGPGKDTNGHPKPRLQEAPRGSITDIKLG